MSTSIKHMWILTTHDCFEKQPTHGSNVYGDMYATCLTSSDESLEVERWPPSPSPTKPKKQKKKQTKTSTRKKGACTWKTQKTTWAVGGWCHFFWTSGNGIDCSLRTCWVRKFQGENFPKNQICWQQRLGQQKAKSRHFHHLPVIVGEGTKTWRIKVFSQKNTTPFDNRKLWGGGQDLRPERLN